MVKHIVEQQLQERILIMDGAMGTMLQNAQLTEEDFGGEALDGCNENLVLTRPDVLRKIHTLYLEAGADLICTNTFGATPLVLDDYDIGYKAEEINKRAAQLAREAVDQFSTPEWPRFVVGAMGQIGRAHV